MTLGQTTDTAFLNGDGEMAALIRAVDWSSTPLGPVETWPQSLRTTVDLMLGSRLPMFTAWGDELTFLYNEPYAEILGRKHPQALGRPFHVIWAEIWTDIEPLIDAALNGQATYHEDLPLVMNRKGHDEQTWFTFSYSPVRDDDGQVAGMFCACVETTGQVRTHAALQRSEARLRFLDALSNTAAGETEAESILAITTRMTGEHMGASVCAYADMDEDQDGFTIRGDWAAPGSTSIVGHYRLADFGKLAVQELGAGRPLIINDNLKEIAPGEAATFQAIGISATICMPLVKDGVLTALMAVHHKDPHVWTDGELSLIREVTDRSWAHVERVRAEAERREGEERYRALFNALDEGFCIIEFIDGPEGPLSDYVHVEANAAYTENAGIPDVVGQKVRAMVGAEAQGWINLYKGVLDTGQPIRFEKELEATHRWLELAAFRVEPASRNQVAVLFKDLTAKKRAEEALQALNANLEQRVADALAERRLLADIVEGSDAFVQVADTDLRWLAINKAAADEFEKVFGQRPQVGVRMTDLLDHLPEEKAAVEAVWRRAMAEPYTEVHAFGDEARSRGFYEMHFSPLYDADGKVVAAYQFVYDVTERLNEQARLRDAEEALRQAQKMEAVGQLTGGIAHDFNNLLAGISGSLELLDKRISQGRTAEVGRYVEAAQGASRRAAALTQRLLAFSRRQTLDPKPTDIARLIGGMVDLIRRSVGPTVEVEVRNAPDLWPTRIDPSQLENALLNLCINSRDAMAPDGGRLTIEAGNEHIDDARAREFKVEPGDYVRLSVADTGAGMTPELIARIFEPFFTTKPMGQGTGLGLSMIHGFVRQSGGQVRADSTPGEGTIMSLYLPRHQGAVETESDAGRTTRTETSRGESVLVIDDEPTVRMLIVEVLEEAGYTALQAEDGPSGVAILESDARIDLLVTDVGLPGGMNGRQVADAARQARPGLKVLFVTGYAESDAVREGDLEPGMAVMTKPFVVADLGARIREMIEA